MLFVEDLNHNLLFRAFTLLLTIALLIAPYLAGGDCSYAEPLGFGIECKVSSILCRKKGLVLLLKI